MSYIKHNENENENKTFDYIDRVSSKNVNFSHKSNIQQLTWTQCYEIDFLFAILRVMMMRILKIHRLIKKNVKCKFCKF